MHRVRLLDRRGNRQRAHQRAHAVLELQHEPLLLLGPQSLAVHGQADGQAAGVSGRHARRPDSAHRRAFRAQRLSGLGPARRSSHRHRNLPSAASAGQSAHAQLESRLQDAHRRAALPEDRLQAAL